MTEVGDHHLEYFFEISVDMLCIAGLDGYFKRVNPAFTKTLGYSSEELLGRPFVDFVHPEDRNATQAEIARLAEGIDTVYFENRYRCKDGSFKWLEWTCPAPNEENDFLYAVARDVTPQREQREQLARLANDDPLTGLANRRVFLAEVGRALGRARRSEGHRVALLYIDVDKLKRINDDMGHHIGDGVLQWFASALSSCVRAEDLVGRLGGDELAILLQGQEVRPEVVAVCILRFFSRPVTVGPNSVPVSASIGISLSDGQHVVDDLIRTADAAMYEAKIEGGGRFRLFSE